MRRDSGPSGAVAGYLHTSTGRRVTGGTSGPPPLALVQHVETLFTAPSGPVTVAKPTAGNLLLAWANADITISTPTDNGANSWTLGPEVIDGNACYIWYRVATAGDASSLTTVTFTEVVSSFVANCGVMEFSGFTSVSPYDTGTQVMESGSSGTTSPAIGPITTTGASGDLVVFISANHGNGSIPVGVNPSWTNGYANIPFSPDGGSGGGAVVTTFGAYLNQVPAGSTTSQVTWTNDFGDRQSMIIAFALG